MEKLQKSQILSPYIVDKSEYKIGKEIGSGAFGKVYLATHISTGTKVAIKELVTQKLSKRQLTDFTREISIMAECTSRFVLPFIGWTDNYPYSIITQYASNGSLFSSLRAKKNGSGLSPTQKTIIAIGVAYGMLELHNKSVIHRDLKSLNVLLDENYHPFVCDFGLSRFARDEDCLKTQDIGTPHWMAPELFESNQYTSKVDVYSYGMLLWEMLTGASPYKGKTGCQIAIAVTQKQERPAFPKDTPRDLAALISACWQQNPAKRPTFKKICGLLKDDKYYFEGTDSTKVEMFLESIEQPYSPTCKLVKNRVVKQPKFNKDIVANPKELSNPNYPYYQQNFKLCYRQYGKSENLPNLLAYISAAITPTTPDDILDFIFKQCVYIASSSDEGFDAFYTSLIYKMLPTNRRSCASSILALINILSIKRPDLITHSLLSKFTSYVSTVSRKFLKIINTVLLYFGKLPNCWEISTFLMDIAPHVMESESTLQYIQLISMMLVNFEDWKTKFLAQALTIFLHGLNLHNSTISRTIYSTLIDLNINSLPMDIVVSSLEHEGNEEGALSYLFRIEFIPTFQLVQALLSLSSHPTALAILFRIADKDSFYYFFPSFKASWLIDGSISCESSIRLVCLLLGRKEYRELIGRIPEVHTWLKFLAETGNANYVAATSTIIVKIGVNDSFVSNLNNTGYFRSYVNSLLFLTEDIVVSGALYLIDSVSRIAYIECFKEYIPKMIEFASSEDDILKKASISALSSMSLIDDFHEPMQKVMNINNFINSLGSSCEYEVYQSVLKQQFHL